MATMGSVGLAACSKVDKAATNRALAAQTEASREAWTPLPAEPPDVYRIVASDGTHQVELLHDDLGVWNPGEGASDLAAALMPDAEKVLLPTLAYRRLAVDASDPQFGLVRPQYSLLVETRTAQQYRIDLGAQTLNGGGYYARTSDQSYVYTVIPAVYDYLKSMLVGEKIVRPTDPRINEAIKAIDATDDPEEVKNPWLGQALRATG